MKGSVVVRAFVGLAVLVTLILVVRGWFGEYRDASDRARSAAQQSQEETTTPSEENGEGEDAGDSVDEGSSDKPDNTVVVLIDGLNFRSAAKDSARSLRGLDKGEKLELLSERDGWYEVKDDDGVTGWVSANSTYTKTERR